MEHLGGNEIWDFAEVRKYLHDTDRLVDEYTHLFPGLQENVAAIDRYEKARAAENPKYKRKNMDSSSSRQDDQNQMVLVPASRRKKNSSAFSNRNKGPRGPSPIFSIPSEFDDFS